MDIQKAFLNQRVETRPMRERIETVAVVMHWTGVANQRAHDVIQFWNTRPTGTYGSAHCVVDIDGTVHQSLPWNEVAYHVGSREYTRFKEELAGQANPNELMVGVELCVINSEGELTDQTWDAAVGVAGMLLRRYELSVASLITHQMVVGWKDCPRWFVRRPDEFDLFRRHVGQMI